MIIFKYCGQITDNDLANGPGAPINMKMNNTSIVFLICSVAFYVGAILSFILTDGIYGYLSLALGSLWLCLGVGLSSGKSRKR